MTVLVGISCADGLVIGADSSATFGRVTFHTIEQPVKKVHIVSDSVIVAGTGAVGLHQRFQEVLSKAFTDRVFAKGTTLEIAKQICARGSTDFSETGVQKGQYGALVGFYANGEYNLFELDVDHFQPELKTADMWFASMGSGQPITDPFLGFLRRIFWRDGPPPLKEAIFAVTWALNHAIELNTGGIKAPAQIAVLTKNDANRIEARLLTDDEIQEHNDNVAAAEEHLRQYQNTLSDETGEDIPEP